MSASYLTLEAFGSNIQEWTPEDMKERREMLGGEVRLKRIARPDAGPVKEDTGEREAVDPNRIELRDVDALLNITGYIPLDLGDTGRIALGTKSDDAVTALKLKSQTKRRLNWELEQMAVTVEELNFGGNKVHGDKPGGAEIHINGVEDGSITFTNGKLLSPKKLEGVITEATVKNLAVDLAEEK
jgi:hypothetical protein